MQAHQVHTGPGLSIQDISYSQNSVLIIFQCARYEPKCELLPSWLCGVLQEFLGISEGFGFTRRNEVFVGRTAMLGFAAELIGKPQLLVRCSCGCLLDTGPFGTRLLLCPGHTGCFF
jgi:hypothetical protein